MVDLRIFRKRTSDSTGFCDIAGSYAHVETCLFKKVLYALCSQENGIKCHLFPRQSESGPTGSNVSRQKNEDFEISFVSKELDYVHLKQKEITGEICIT